MPMYNLLEFSKNHSVTPESLWNYQRGEVKNDANENNDANNKINSNKTIGSKSFEYKAKIIGRMSHSDNTLDT